MYRRYICNSGVHTTETHGELEEGEEKEEMGAKSPRAGGGSIEEEGARETEKNEEKGREGEWRGQGEGCQRPECPGEVPASWWE